MRHTKNLNNIPSIIFSLREENASLQQENNLLKEEIRSLKEQLNKPAKSKKVIH